MSSIKFRIAAKTDMGLVRTNNEDNFQAAADLSSGQMRWINNEICSLGDKGALLVVADGMGGMNAGEVASEIAIATVRDCFATERLTAEVTKSRYSIEKYMNDTVVLADARIKAEAAKRPETRGMGTTIVIGWVLDGKLYVSWCGDSRAYVYNPAAGLHQITKDHSYVQSLVDKGSISHEDAFDFPDSNIITRCLSDASTKAKPESLLRPYEVCNNDIILLCTDGLCGMIRDNEIEQIIRANEHNMDELSDRLIQGACDAEGSDNITICLCQIMQGGKVCDPTVFVESDKRLRGKSANLTETVIKDSNDDDDHKKCKFCIIGLIALLVIVIGGILYWCFSNSGNDANSDDNKEKVDSVREEQPVPDVAPDEGQVTPPETDIQMPSEEQLKALEEKAKKQHKTDTKEPQKDQKKQDKNKNSEKKDEQNADKDDLFNTGKSINALEDLKTESKSTEAKAETKTTDNQSNTKQKTKTKNYLVKKGDSYSSIADSLKIKVAVLQKVNNNKPLKAGETIQIPVK